MERRFFFRSVMIFHLSTKSQVELLNNSASTLDFQA